MLPSLFRPKILISLNGVFWNTLTPLETLIRHISIFAIFTQSQIRLWRFLSLKRITMNGIAGYFPILVFNFNLYGIVSTDRSPRCKRRLFVKGIAHHNNRFLLFGYSQIWRNYLQGDDREQHRFLNYILTKQTVKICSFCLVWRFFHWNLYQAEVTLLWN